VISGGIVHFFLCAPSAASHHFFQSKSKVLKIVFFRSLFFYSKYESGDMKLKIFKMTAARAKKSLKDDPPTHKT